MYQNMIGMVILGSIEGKDMVGGQNPAPVSEQVPAEPRAPYLILWATIAVPESKLNGNNPAPPSHYPKSTFESGVWGVGHGSMQLENQLRGVGFLPPKVASSEC